MRGPVRLGGQQRSMNPQWRGGQRGSHQAKLQHTAAHCPSPLCPGWPSAAQSPAGLAVRDNNAKMISLPPGSRSVLTRCLYARKTIRNIPFKESWRFNIIPTAALLVIFTVHQKPIKHFFFLKREKTCTLPTMFTTNDRWLNFELTGRVTRNEPERRIKEESPF